MKVFFVHSIFFFCFIHACSFKTKGNILLRGDGKEPQQLFRIQRERKNPPVSALSLFLGWFIPRPLLRQLFSGFFVLKGTMDFTGFKVGSSYSLSKYLFRALPLAQNPEDSKIGSNNTVRKTVWSTLGSIGIYR